MFTPISDRWRQAALVAACLVLSGCGSSWFEGLGGHTARAPTEVVVTTDRIVVSGPEGFCVDPTATQDTADTGFVLLGNCAAIANSRRAAQPAIPAVLTATVSEPSDSGRLADSLSMLDDFFRSDTGLALLSRSGDPASVTILDTAVEGEVFLLHATDRSAGTIDGVQQDYWRAYLDVGPRIATLSVLALADRGLSREESLSTLQSFVQAVQAANPIPEATEPAEGVAPVQAEEGNRWPNIPALWNIGIFRQILG
jgi:hypothetical protein